MSKNVRQSQVPIIKKSRMYICKICKNNDEDIHQGENTFICTPVPSSYSLLEYMEQRVSAGGIAQEAQRMAAT